MGDEMGAGDMNLDMAWYIKEMSKDPKTLLHWSTVVYELKKVEESQEDGKTRVFLYFIL